MENVNVLELLNEKLKGRVITLGDFEKPTVRPILVDGKVIKTKWPDDWANEVNEGLEEPTSFINVMGKLISEDIK